ncbi:MAG: O-methyltransferase [Bacilli bacterium]|nr:O-methyltransferase [Bacilli bacterium]
MVRILIEEMEAYAKENNVPIMLSDGISFLENYIREHHVKKILELGTAIGYSAIRMALISKDIQVITIERDNERYQKAIENIKKTNLENQICVFNQDIMDFETKEEFDLIFIDAAKSQYIKFFEKFSPNLVKGGTIISDNLNFHGYTKQETRIESKNLRQMVGKIRNYIEFLKENKKFETIFLELGDGIGISVKL